MRYDPLKSGLGKFFNRNTITRKLFFFLLDLLLLRAWYIKREIRKWARQQKSSNSTNILDAGAGFGQYVYFISGLSEKFNVKAVDLKEELISDCTNFFSKTKRAGRVTFETGDLTNFVEKENFDMILSVDVMEHIENDRKVFSNFFTSLRPGGLLIISTPFANESEADMEENEKPFIEEHIREGYTPGNISEKLKTAGFSSVETCFSYGFPGHLSWILSVKYPVIIYNKCKLLFLFIPLYYIIVLPFCLLLNFIDIKRENRSGKGLVVKARK